MTLKYESELIKEIVDTRGHETPLLHYESECVESWISESEGAYPKLSDYEAEWLNYIIENPIGKFPYVTLSDVTEATVENVVPYAYKSAILTGQTLVNLFNPNDITTSNTDMYMENGYIILPVKNHRYNHLQIPKEKCQMFEAGEKYTLWVHMLENVTENNDGETQQGSSFFLQSYDYGDSIVKTSNQGAYGCRFDNNEVGTKMCVFEMHDKETMETKSGGLNFDLQSYYAKTGGIQKLAIVILKGDWSNNELPFDKPFYGMQSVKLPVLTTTGKNLFNESEKIEGYFTSNSSKERLETDIKNTWTTYWIKAKPNTEYIISGGNRNRWQLKSYSGAITFTESETIMTLSDTEYIRCYYCNESYTAANVQLEEGSTKTTYEPYKSNVLTVNEPIELRGIDDVKDTLDCLTGEIVSNFSTYSFSDVDDWKTNKEVNCQRFNLRISPSPIGSEYPNKVCIISDKLPAVKWNQSWETVNTISCNGDSIAVQLPLGTTIEQCKELMRGTKIVYRIKSSIKTVDLTCINEQGESETFRPIEGTMHVNTSSQTLPPLLDMSVPVEATTQNLMSFINIEEEE